LWQRFGLWRCSYCSLAASGITVTNSAGKSIRFYHHLDTDTNLDTYANAHTYLHADQYANADADVDAHADADTDNYANSHADADSHANTNPNININPNGNGNRAFCRYFGLGSIGDNSGNGKCDKYSGY
jgi:hypothetical protein